jgi:hypothetical protein
MMRAPAYCLVGLLTQLITVPTAAFAQTCPEPLASARRLVLVVADGMTTSTASVQRFERAAAVLPRHALGRLGACLPAAAP